mmetsp:Transcript_8055/g.10554  ORF Transcript_8055/g.10554 Transcript_8055/m.10554 type:complete len:299 (-) Transcript_8055:412-1308(-)
MSASTISIARDLFKMFWNEERDAEVRAFAKAPMFRPMEYILQRVIPEIVEAVFFCTIIYVFSFYFVDHLAPKGLNQLKRNKLCYQITNFFANLLLGTAGFYYNAQLNESPTPQELVQKEGMHFFASFQLGYQFWAIPVGLLFVKEDPLMILHHVAVIFAASTMVFFTNGMRYWAPFVLGCVEICSVPLAVMNAFKDNQDWIKKYPEYYLYVRTAFALIFLHVRVWMFIPRNCMQMYDHVMTWSNSDNTVYQIYSFLVFFSSLFLTFLQVKWGYLIVRGFVKMYADLLVGNKRMKAKTA